MPQNTQTEWTPFIPKTSTLPGAFNKPVPVRFPSNWKPVARGKLLTNAKIAEYARLGVYGPEEKRKALADFEAKHGIRVCVVCNKKGCFPIRSWDWLEKKGPYCQLCLAKLRTERDKEKNERKQWREKVKMEYV